MEEVFKLHLQERHWNKFWVITEENLVWLSNFTSFFFLKLWISGNGRKTYSLYLLVEEMVML